MGEESNSILSLSRGKHERGFEVLGDP